MSENLEGGDLTQSESPPHSIPPPKGDLPADFFDDVTDSSRDPVVPLRPPSPQTLPPFVTDDAPHFENVENANAPESTPLTFEPSPAAFSQVSVPYVTRRERPFRGFPVIAGLGLAGLAGLVWYATRDRAVPAKAEPAVRPASTVYEPPETPTPVQATPPATDALQEVRSRLDALAVEVKGLREKLDAPKFSSPTSDELKPVSEKPGELDKVVADLKPLSDEYKKMDGRVGSLEMGLSTLKEEVASLASDAKKPTTLPAGTTDPDKSATDAAIRLFVKGSYKDADVAFKAIERSDPKDARYWYFAGLARGAATGNWTGETVRLVTRGAELEKAGETPATEVDAVLDTFPASFNTFKTWVNAYRKPGR